MSSQIQIAPCSSIPRFDRAPRDLAPELRAVLAARPALADDRLAGREPRHGFVAELLEVVDARREHRAVLPRHLAGGVAEQLLEPPVAARDLAVAHERDADRGRVQDRFLLAQRALELVALALPLGDVLRDPHRALLQVVLVDRLGDHVARKELPSLRRSSHSSSSRRPADSTGTAIRASSSKLSRDG
jgi:hypothetical protein